MNVLVMTEDVQTKLDDLVAYAHKNPYTMDMMLDVYNGETKPPGDNEEYVCHVPVDFKVVLTVELQRFTVLHISIGKADGKLPHPTVVQEIMKMTGFKKTLFENLTWIEKGNAVNVVEKLD